MYANPENPDEGYQYSMHWYLEQPAGAYNDEKSVQNIPPLVAFHSHYLRVPSVSFLSR
jgi:hypothetical protein